MFEWVIYENIDVLKMKQKWRKSLPLLQCVASLVSSYFPYVLITGNFSNPVTLIVVTSLM